METFPRYWPFVRGIHRSPVNSPHKGQWRGALIFSLICVWINGWVNNREAGGLRRPLWRHCNEWIYLIDYVHGLQCLALLLYDYQQSLIRRCCQSPVDSVNLFPRTLQGYVFWCVLALRYSYNCPGANEVILKDMGKNTGIKSLTKNTTNRFPRY